MSFGVCKMNAFEDWLLWNCPEFDQIVPPALTWNFWPPHTRSLKLLCPVDDDCEKGNFNCHSVSYQQFSNYLKEVFKEFERIISLRKWLFGRMCACIGEFSTIPFEKCKSDKVTLQLYPYWNLKKYKPIQYLLKNSSFEFFSPTWNRPTSTHFSDLFISSR